MEQVSIMWIDCLQLPDACSLRVGDRPKVSRLGKGAQESVSLSECDGQQWNAPDILTRAADTG